MPVIHHQSKKGFYTELRYNYEDSKTVSLYFGKNFSGGKELNFDITPMLGVVAGRYNGGSFAMNMELEYKRIFLSADAQYTVHKSRHSDNFFFSWSELTYHSLKWLFTGISVQQTKLNRQETETEYGMLLCIATKKISFPVYLFSPFSNDQNFIIGINMQW